MKPGGPAPSLTRRASEPEARAVERAPSDPTVLPVPKAWPTLAVALLSALHMLLHARLFTAPRLWAEEMNVYFAHAVTHGALEQMLFLYERTGYFYLAANLSVMLAALVPLDLAAHVTTWLSALIVGLCLWKLIDLHRTRVLEAVPMLILAAGLLFGGFASYEIWYNSINTQVFLGVLALLVLLQQVHGADQGRRGGFLDFLVLLLAGLSGPYAALLWPLFLVAWGVFRATRLLCSSLLLLACFIVQASIAIATRTAGTMVAGKVEPEKLGNLGSVLEALSASVFPKSFALPLSALAAIAVVVACAIRLRGSPRDKQGWLLLLTLAAIGSWTLLVTVASHVEVGGRYLFAPGFALLLAMVLAARFVGSKSLGALLFAGLGATALLGLLSYPLETLRNCDYCPSWREGVEQVRVPFSPASYNPPYHLDWICRDPQSGKDSHCRKQIVDSQMQLCAILAESVPRHALHANLRTDSTLLRLDRDGRVAVVAWPHDRWRGWVPLAQVIGCE